MEFEPWSYGGDPGKIIVATGFEWLPQSAKNSPIWSHCYLLTKNLIFLSSQKVESFLGLFRLLFSVFFKKNYNFRNQFM